MCVSIEATKNRGLEGKLVVWSCCLVMPVGRAWSALPRPRGELTAAGQRESPDAGWPVVGWPRDRPLPPPHPTALSCAPAPRGEEDARHRAPHARTVTQGVFSSHGLSWNVNAPGREKPVCLFLSRDSSHSDVNTTQH